MLTARLFSRNIIKITAPVLPGINRDSGKAGASVCDLGDAWEPPDAIAQRALDSIGEFQDEDFSPKALLGGWGKMPSKTQFGHRGRDRVMDSVCYLDRLVDRKLFLTVTIPGSGVKVAKEVSRWSGYIVNLLRQRFRDLSSKLKCRSELVHVWEWQKRGQLHLHAVLWSDSEEFLENVKGNLQKIWMSLIDGICLKSGRDLWRKTATYTHSRDKSVLQVDCQWIRVSASGYLAKYLSKSIGKEVRKGWFCPSRWWGTSRGLLRKSLAESVLLAFPVFRNSPEDSVIELAKEFQPYTIGSKLVVSESTNTVIMYLLLDRNRYGEARAMMLEKRSVQYPSCSLEATEVFRMCPVLSAYRSLDKKTVEMEAFCEIWQKEKLPGTFRGTYIEVNPDIWREFMAATVLYFGVFPSPWTLSQIFEKVRMGTLFGEMKAIFFRETSEGGEF